MDELHPLRWCLLDSLCVGVVVGVVSSLVGAGRRLWVACEWPRGKRRPVRMGAYCLCGAGATGLVGFSLVVIGGEWWPAKLKGIAALVLLGSVAWDYSSDVFAKLIRGALLEITKASLSAALKALGGMTTTPSELSVERFPDELSDELSEDSR